MATSSCTACPTLPSTSWRPTKLWEFSGDDKELSIENSNDRFIYPTLEKFSLHLFSPLNWEAVPGAKLAMGDWESVTCAV